MRPKVPLLIASTLLIPGYIDEKEINELSKFIANLNPEIPYRLLAFYPHFYMRDLPLTSKNLAYRCYEIAKKNGLKRVSIGNIHLLH
jgi:pyruvate formate lyase activating enzyme